MDTIYDDELLMEDFPEKNKHRGERRKQDFQKALRKNRIVREVYHAHPLSEENVWHYYDNLHTFSKNKIHCSCPMCSEKTNTKSYRGKGYGYRGIRENDAWIRPPMCRYTENGGIEVISPGIPKDNFNLNYGITNHRNKKNWKISDNKKLMNMSDIESDWDDSTSMGFPREEDLINRMIYESEFWEDEDRAMHDYLFYEYMEEQSGE